VNDPSWSGVPMTLCHSRCTELCVCSCLGVCWVQVWNLTNCKLKTNHFGHNGYLNCVTVSPDGSLCASGGKVRIISRTWQQL